MPRPSKAAETRDCRIALFVTPSKLASIKRAAEMEGIPRAAYLRRILTWGTALFYADPATREKVWALLSDSDGSPEGGDAEGGSVRSTTARAEGIARKDQP